MMMRVTASLWNSLGAATIECPSTWLQTTMDIMGNTSCIGKTDNNQAESMTVDSGKQNGSSQSSRDY